jgi:hypothetical protein
MSRRVRVQDLLGREVLAANNHGIGRIEEIRAEKRGKGYVVKEYHLGPAALLERLSTHVGTWFGRPARMRVVAWDQLDLSDPASPRLLVEAAALPRLGDEGPSGA